MTTGMGERSFLAPLPRGPLDRGRPPTFSVVVAAHDAAGTIAEAVESALVQTVPPLEVIVVDDGSTDATVEAVEPFGDRVVAVSMGHAGVASARNAALERARGDFVAVLDADDAYLPERLEALTELAVSRPDLDILCTDAVLEVEGRPVATFAEGCAFEVADQRSAILQRCFCVAPAYRRAALLEAGGFDESLRTGEDWECLIRLLYAGAAAGAVAEPLYRYRFHERSLTANRASTLADRVALLEQVRLRVALTDREREALAGSLAAQRASLALTQAEAALRSRSPDARARALAAARTSGVPARARVAALAAALAPSLAARALERRELRSGHSHLRRFLAPGGR